MSVILTQSLYNGNEFYLFRPIGNDNYKEIKFKILKNEIVLEQNAKLNMFELDFIQRKLLASV